MFFFGKDDKEFEYNYKMREKYGCVDGGGGPVPESTRFFVENIVSKYDFHYRGKKPDPTRLLYDI